MKKNPTVNFKKYIYFFLHHQNSFSSLKIHWIGALWHADPMLFYDWSRAKGRFPTPIGTYKDVHFLLDLHLCKKAKK